MKKILSILLVIITLVVLAGCTSPADSTVSRDEFNLLLERIAVLEDRFDNLVVTEGINGNKVYYENTQDEEPNFSVSIETMNYDTEDEKFNVNDNAPDYMKSIDGSYISISEVGSLLKNKYFADTSNGYNDEVDRFEDGSKLLLRFVFNGEFTDAELLARATFLIEEFKLYKAYFIDANELEIDVMQVDNDGFLHRVIINISMKSVINDYYVIDLESIYKEYFEIDVFVDGISTTYLDIQSAYDELVLEELFVGYVLDYK